MATESILRPGELKAILLKEIEAADLAALDVQDLGSVLEVKDGIARVYGLSSAMAGEMLEFTASKTHQTVAGLALNLEEDNLGAVILGDYLQLREGDEVRRTGRVLEVPVGQELVGRVVNPLGQPLDGLGPHLKGPTGLVISKQDPVALAKALQAFVKTNALLQIKLGYVEGQLLAPAEIRALADLPSREALRAKLVGAIQGPLAQLVGLLTAPHRELVYVLQQRGKGAAE